jgi:hypothetical protein
MTGYVVDGSVWLVSQAFSEEAVSEVVYWYYVT